MYYTKSVQVMHQLVLLLCQQFQSQFPRVTWTIHELGPDEQWDALRGKQIDVGFWREPKRDEDDLIGTQRSGDECGLVATRAATHDHDSRHAAIIAHGHPGPVRNPGGLPCRDTWPFGRGRGHQPRPQGDNLAA